MNQSDFISTIDIKSILSLLWDKKIFISLTVSIFALISIIYALSLPNIYTSKTLLAPSKNENSISSNMGSLSSLASIGGFNLPNEGVSKTQEAIERIKSFDFFTKYFLPNVRLEDLMAVKKWIPESNTLIYDDEIFDENKGGWLQNSKTQSIPTKQDAYKKYKDILKISENASTFFVSLSIDHESPFIAKEWVDIIVLNINESMREQDKEYAQSSIDFLEEQFTYVNIQTIKDAISNLLENQIQVLMMASSNQAYVFEVLDSSFVPEEKSRPSRALICILGTILGSVFAILFVLIRYFFNPKEENN